MLDMQELQNGRQELLSKMSSPTSLGGNTATSVIKQLYGFISRDHILNCRS